MKLTLYPHGGSGNHGCEAIVRATARITGANLSLFSSRPNEDKQYGLDAVCAIQRDSRQTDYSSFLFWKSYIQFKFGNTRALDIYSYSRIIQEAINSDYALSIGGDNYCYGVPEHIYLINQELRRRGVKTILWGCSIEPNAMDERMLNDLRGYHHIIARESITYNALVEHGIERVSLIPDPAFQLQRVDLPLPKGFLPGNTVGINVSPMIVSHEKHKGVTMENYKTLIEHILNQTEMSIALIPHVVWANNDDRKPLSELYRQYNHSGRVVMIDDCNAEQLKGYIARCRFMIAARTHASIAAYSSRVPTIVIGYSVKARGIAKDIFDSNHCYVLPIENLDSSNKLTDYFNLLKDNEEIVRNHLDKTITFYCSKVENLNNLFT